MFIDNTIIPYQGSYVQHKNAAEQEFHSNRKFFLKIVSQIDMAHRLLNLKRRFLDSLFSICHPPYNERSFPMQEFFPPGLDTGQFYSLRIEVASDSYVYVLFYDSFGYLKQWHPIKPDGFASLFYGAGENPEPFAPDGKLPGSHVLIITESANGSRLRNDFSIGTVFILTSHDKIENFDERYHRLMREGISRIHDLFPDVSIRVARFVNNSPIRETTANRVGSYSN